MTSISSVTNFNHSLEIIRDEARLLLEQRKVSRGQHLYVLCQYLPAREWFWIEAELEKAEYLLRDSIGDLLSKENWDCD